MAEDGFEIAKAFVSVDPDTEGFSEKLKAALDEAVADARASVPIDADISPLEAKVEDAKAKLDELKEEPAEATLDADDEALTEKTDSAKAKLGELDSTRTESTLDANDDALKEKTDSAEESLAGIDATKATATITADDDPAKATLADLRAELAILRLQKQGFYITADASPAEIQIAQLEAQIEALKAEGKDVDIGGGGSGGGLSGLLGPLGEHPLMAGIGGALIGLSPGIAGAATGLGMLGGVGALALSGIFKAVSASHQASLDMSQYSQQLAATEFQDSVQIQQAQVAIGQAHMQAAQDAANSANEIIQAEQAVGQAEHSLSDAQYSEQQAQVSLTEARIQARLTLQQLQDQLAESTLAEQSAKLALQQAEYQQMLTDQNAYSTSLDRAQAALAVRQAEEQVTLSVQGRKNATMEASSTDEQYFDGQQQVIAAEHALTDAQYGVRQAMLQVGDAIRNLALTRQNAADTAQRDAEAEQEAEQNLTNTIKEQGLQLQELKAQSPYGTLARDMARLSPAGRELVREILSLRGAFKDLETIAQTTIAPGMVQFFRGLSSLMPTIARGAREMGTAISNSFAQFGRQMQTSGFATVFQGLIRNGLQFVRTVLPAFAGLIQELARVGAQRGAVSGLANLLAGLAHGLTGIVQGVAPFTKGLSSLFSTLGKALAAIGRPLGEVVGALGSALAPALHALLPGFRTLVDALGSGLSTALTGISPLLTTVAKGVSGIMTALAPLLPPLGQLIAAVAAALTPAVTALVRPLVQVATTLAQAMVPVIRALTPDIGILGQMMATLVTEGLVPMLQAYEPLIPIVGNLVRAVAPLIQINLDMTDKILSVVLPAFEAWNKYMIGPVIQGISTVVSAVTGMKGSIIPLFDDIGAAATYLWQTTFSAMFHGIESGASAFVGVFRSIWHGIESAFKTPVNFLINTVYDSGIRRFWNDVVNAVGLKSLDLPMMPSLAGGGTIPGYAPGHDSVPALLSPGEGILTPQATAGIGGSGAIDSLNQHFTGGGGHLGKDAVKLPLRELARHLTERPAEHAATFGMFAGGGTVGEGGGGGLGVSANVGPSSGGGGGLLNDITNFLGKAYNVGSIVAALATGNTTALTHGLDALVSTKAAGDLAKIMIALPKTLISDAAKQLASMVGLGGAGGPGGKFGVSVPGAVTGTVASWFAEAVKLTGTSPGWIPDLETIAHYESGDNPNAINLTDSNAAAGDPSRGIMQTIMTTFMGYHQPGTSMNIYNPIANIAAAIRYIKSRYGTVANVPGIVSLSHGGGYVGYDAGGWLPPAGMPGSMPVNSTGQPEAVLSPDESAAFVAIAKRLTAQGTGTAAGLGANVTFQYFGTQQPTVEQQAIMQRQLALTLGA